MSETMGVCWKDALLAKLAERTAKVCVIGLGYVGLPLATEFARAGLSVTGIDVDARKCDAINAGHSYIGDVPSEVVGAEVEAGRLRATTDYAVLAKADAAIICVPTPLRKSKDPDISYILMAADSLAQHVHPGMLVVLESTTYPGTSEEILLPRITGNGLAVGDQVFLAFSPERVDPGNQHYQTHNTPKVVGGMTSACLDVALALYCTAVETVIPVSSPAAAEMVKILENTYRAVNIGLINELATICHRLDLDIWEVIDAAATKPFGFQPFYPGPGLGGHCIPIDPLYLSWKMRGLGVQTRFIELADTINTAMPSYVVRRMTDMLNDQSKPVRGSRILVLGVAYKPNVSDLRESPALSIIQDLRARGAEVLYNDPHVDSLRITPDETMTSVPLTAEILSWADCVLVHTDHRDYHWEEVVAHAKLVFNARHVSLPETNPGCRIERL